MSKPSQGDYQIERPDGSQIAYSKLPPREQLSHDLVLDLTARAEEVQIILRGFKAWAVDQVLAFRQMMLDDYEVSIGGKGGNITLRSVCGRFKVAYTVSKHISFGPELEAAKALIDECLAGWSEDSAPEIKEIITRVFKVNTKGRLDTAGILGLRSHGFKDDRWVRAMDAIDDAIIRDSETTYINFYTVNPETKVETRIALDLAAV